MQLSMSQNTDVDVQLAKKTSAHPARSSLITLVKHAMSLRQLAADTVTSHLRKLKMVFSLKFAQTMSVKRNYKLIARKSCSVVTFASVQKMKPNAHPVLIRIALRRWTRAKNHQLIKMSSAQSAILVALVKSHAFN